MINVFQANIDTKPIKNWASLLEEEAKAQLENLSCLPFIHSHVAVMPDAHAGKGSTVGTVIATKGAIIPAAVGVDIGCGMMAVKLPFAIDSFTRLPELRHSIEREVPVGRHGNKEVSNAVLSWASEWEKPLGCQINEDTLKQCGSLGGGNHFIEICQDQENGAWVVIHSGSRNIGKRLADIHISSAKGLMQKYFISLPDPDLAYLAQETVEFGEYIYDLRWAQSYAFLNRQEMMVKVLGQISQHLFKENLPILRVLEINCHHNYTQMEHHFGSNVWVTRKGAVSAKKDEWGIIPGSMGTRSYIVKGLGNAESFNSCSHGAGRRMSRTKARATFTEEDVLVQTSGVECRKDGGVIDEIPAAYKDIDQVMKDQEDLVVPVYTLKQILCVKG